MEKLKYLKKLLRKRTLNIRGPIFTCTTLEKLFKSFFKNSKFIFHSGFIKNNSLSLIGYRTLLNESDLSSAYLDPFFTINDYGIIRTSNNIGYFESSDNDIREIIASTLKQNFGKEEEKNIYKI